MEVEVKNPVTVIVTVDKDLAVTCDKEPITVRQAQNQDGIEFTLEGDKYEFVGFLSPRDLKHECFDVQNIGVNGKGESVMTVKDKFCEPKDVLYRYELVFQKRGGTPGNLYNHDPQIKNIPA